MGFFESLFYVIWRGVAIGILISAPMGPVGILCIQRTLYKGRKTGLYTGIGAAISDLFYCILTGFGLSFIEEFLERNQNIIQLVGSAVLIAFAVYLFKKNPASSLKTPQEEMDQISPHKNILGGFLFTFSNPLILFLIIGLFARFNFSIPEINFYYYIAGYVGIFFGAVIWWEFVTFSVNKLRAHFNLRSMWLINRIIGVIILLFALVGIITGVSNLANATTLNWNQGRGYSPFVYSTSDGILIDNKSDSLQYDYYSLPEPAEELKLKFRSKNYHGHPSKQYEFYTGSGSSQTVKNPFWGFFFITDSDTIILRITSKEIPRRIESEIATEIIYNSFSNQDTKEIIVTENMDSYQGDNLWKIDINEKRLKVSGGIKILSPILESQVYNEILGFGFYGSWGEKILISDISVEYEASPLSKDDTEKKYDINQLGQYFSETTDPLEGYWTVFDRELEESLLKMGGDYYMACVKEGEKYNLLYLSGGVVNSSDWKTGDVKAILTPSPFKGIYNVDWFDSMKTLMNYEIKAQTGDGNTLTIQFPYQSSKLRLRKISQ